MRNSIITTAALVTALMITTADAATKKKSAPSKKDQTASVVTQPVSVTKSYNWAGPYVGAHAGWGFGSAKQFDSMVDRAVSGIRNETGLTPTFSTSSMDGFLGGLYAGYNFQIDKAVIGAEADLNIGQIKRSTSGSVSLTGLGHTFTGTANVAQSYEMGGSARLRLGYAFDNILPYITAGLAIANTKYHAGGTLAEDGNPWISANYNKSKVQYGYVVGGGIEYAINKNILARAEYLYSEFGKTELGDPSDGLVGSVKLGTKIHQVRAGLAYKF